MLDADHCLKSMAVRVDGELQGRCFRDPTHRAAEQICQASSLAVAYWRHDDIQTPLRSPRCAGDYISVSLTTKSSKRRVDPCIPGSPA
jgi:hypothetical protein